MQQIEVEEPVPPRRINKSIPLELETIVHKAMEKNPADRYRTAQELADDLGRYLEDKPIRARRASLCRRLRGQCRRHKPLVIGLAVLVGTVLFLGASGLWWQFWSYERRRAATIEAVRNDLAEADLWQQQDHWPKALQALERASGRLQENRLDSLQDQVAQRRRQADLVARLNEAQVLASEAYADGTRDFSAADRAYAKAFSEHRLDVATLAAQDVADRIRSSAIGARLVAALDHWAYVKEHMPKGNGEPLRALARLADDDTWRKQLRNPPAARHLDTLQRLAEEEGVLKQPPVSLLLLCYLLDRLPGTPGPWSPGEEATREKAQTLMLRLLRQAQERYPDDFWLNLELGSRLSGQAESLAEAVGYLRAALAVNRRSPVVYNQLGIALLAQGKLADAEAEYRKAIELGPTHPGAHYNLGAVLRAQGKLDDAVEAYRKAIELQPDFAQAYVNLGSVLHDQKKHIDAVEACRKAIAIQPKFAKAHYNLGNALFDLNKLPEAVEAYRKAIELQPDFALGHYNLGGALNRQGKLPEAEKAYRKAIELKQDYAEAYYNLGLTLEGRENLPEAEAAYRKVIDLRLRDHEAHNNLGVVLGKQQKLCEAEEACRKAIEFREDYAPAHCNLGLALREQGRFVESLASLKRAHELGSHTPDWRHPTAQWVLNGEQYVLLDTKLPKILKGEIQPADATERVALAKFCQLPCRQLYAASARFYNEAFAAEPALVADANTGNRYDAACAAALSGCAQGKDANNLKSEEYLRLRAQALAWLRADLDAWGARLEKEPNKARAQVLQKMLHWQRDADLNGVRGDPPRAKLAEAERQDWRKLWQDVEELRKRAAERKKTP